LRGPNGFGAIVLVESLIRIDSLPNLAVDIFDNDKYLYETDDTYCKELAEKLGVTNVLEPYRKGGTSYYDVPAGVICDAIDAMKVAVGLTSSSATLRSPGVYVNPDVIKAATVRQEKPCKVCGRKNDIGVKECWYCTVKDP